ncbi:hypothetical protein OROMI_009610 [Orobanche minor]
MVNSTSPNVRRYQNGVADTTRVATDSTAIAANAIVGSAKNQGRIQIDTQHLDAYMGILHFDPRFVGMRWLDDWAAQAVLVHTSFLDKSCVDHLDTCPESWNGHWVVLLAKEGIIIMHDSLVQEHYARGKLTSRQASGICCVIPKILQHYGFYERHPDITLIDRFQIAVVRWDLCYI